jgi:hypothetical protein
MQPEEDPAFLFLMIKIQKDQYTLACCLQEGRQSKPTRANLVYVRKFFAIRNGYGTTP